MAEEYWVRGEVVADLEELGVHWFLSPSLQRSVSDAIEYIKVLEDILHRVESSDTGKVLLDYLLTTTAPFISYKELLKK